MFGSRRIERCEDIIAGSVAPVARADAHGRLVKSLYGGQRLIAVQLVEYQQVVIFLEGLELPRVEGTHVDSDEQLLPVLLLPSSDPGDHVVGPGHVADARVSEFIDHVYPDVPVSLDRVQDTANPLLAVSARRAVGRRVHIVAAVRVGARPLVAVAGGVEVVPRPPVRAVLLEPADLPELEVQHYPVLLQNRYVAAEVAEVLVVPPVNIPFAVLHLEWMERIRKRHGRGVRADEVHAVISLPSCPSPSGREVAS